MPSRAPTVSVVLPTCNRPHTLPRAMASVLRQTFVDLELVVIDDASEGDDTRQVVERAAEGDARVRYLRQPQRSGASAARNAGIRAARGEFIAFQDDDDEWLLDKLASQMTLLEKLGAECALVGGDLLRYGRRPQARFFPWRSGAQRPWIDPVVFIDGRYAFMQSALVRARVLHELGGFDEEMPTSEDWELGLRLLQRYRAAALPQLTVMSFEQPSGLLARPDLRAQSFRRLLRKHADSLAARRAVAGILHYEIAKCELDQSHWRAAWAPWRAALRAEPGNPKYWLFAGLLLLGPVFGVRLAHRLRRRADGR